MTNAGTVTVNGTGSITWTSSVPGAVATDRFGAAITANDLVLTAAVAVPTGPTGGGAAPAGALNVYAGTNAGALQLAAAFQTLTAPQARAAASQLSPADANAAGTQAATSIVNNIGTTIVHHSAQVRDANGTCLAAGEAARGLQSWIQGFGFSNTQDTREGYDGHTADGGGLVIGFDTKVLDAACAGISFSLARTNVDNTGARSGSGQDIDSYGGTVYLNYYGTPWFLDALLIYTRHEYASSRLISFPGFNSTVTADYDANQYTGRIDGGYLIALASFTASRLDMDGYSEDGTGSLTVQKNDVTSLKSTVVLRLPKDWKITTSTLTT